MDFAPKPRQPGPSLPSAEGPPASSARSPFPLWMERLFFFVRVSFALWIGLFLLVIPWLDGGRIFAGNRLVQDYPAVRAFLAHGFVRGAISGIGLVDMWLGIWEAVHYKQSIHG